MKNKNSLGFLLSKLLMVVLPVALIGIVLLYQQSQSISFFRAIVQKRQVLEDPNRGPATFTIGGSALAFGLDVAHIRAQTKRNFFVHNIHAGLGSAFVLDESKYLVRPKDTVIICFEHQLLTKKAQIEGSSKTLSATIPFAPELYVQYPKYLVTIPSSVQVYWNGLFLGKSAEGPNYRFESFGPYGNITSHLKTEAGQETKDLSFRMLTEEKLNDEIAKHLDDYIAHCKEIGATTYLIFPPYPRSTYEANRVVIDRLNADLQKRYASIVISSPDSAFYPDSLFLDTFYHLNHKGVAKYTTYIESCLSGAVNRH